MIHDWWVAHRLEIWVDLIGFAVIGIIFLATLIVDFRRRKR